MRISDWSSDVCSSDLREERPTMKTYRIASIPGDGIGPEVITAGVEVLQAVAAREGRFALEVRTFPWGADHYRAHGVMMPEDGVDTLRGFDAIYFGDRKSTRLNHSH